MTTDDDGRRRSRLVGSVRPPGDDARGSAPGLADPDEPIPMIIELNVQYPGGLDAVRRDFYDLWRPYQDLSRAHQQRSVDSTVEPPVPRGLALVSSKLYQCVLRRSEAQALVDDDSRRANDRPGAGSATTIFRIWPDYTLFPQIDRSASTVKADAAWRSYAARGRGVVWAVIDSGIEASHPHFAELELAQEGRAVPPPQGRTNGLHRDFTDLVEPGDPASPSPADGPGLPAGSSPLTDTSGHGTHVAGIIAGASSEANSPLVGDSMERTDGGFVQRPHTLALSGMAPNCELVSLKVIRRNPRGQWVTSSAAVIRALTYLRTEVNVDPGLLRVHGVNMSLGSDWEPDHYAAGQSPLCQAVEPAVNSGVLVVISSGR